MTKCLINLWKILDYLSFCACVISLRYSFLRNLFDFLSILAMNFYTSHSFLKLIILNLRWWLTFLWEWNGIRMIRSYRLSHFIYINISDVKGIDEWFKHRAFSIELSQHHKKKHINWKKTCSILYALSKWAHLLKNNIIIFIYNNEFIINILNKHIIQEEIIYILQFIYFIIILYNIKLLMNWLSFNY